jgi:DNA-binding CsgD family transcriptional regulator
MERAKSAQRQHFYFRHHLASEKIRDVEVYSGPIMLHGKQLLYSIIHDISKRKQAEEKLRKVHDGLEQRTAELVRLNEKLQQEIEARKQVEQELKKREAELEIRTSELEEVNSALRVLLKRRDEDKTELEEKVLYNVKELVVPYVERLKSGALDAKQTAYVSILESNLHNIVSAFAHKMSSKYLGLTPTEIQIANLVKQGRTTKEIAEILNSSDRTVEFHRKNIRKKIGIVNRKVNLRSHLLSM